MNRFLRPALFAALAFGASTVSSFAQTPSASPSASPQGPPPGRHGPPPPSELFKALDTNHDGTISAEELANAPASLKAIADSSGSITHESLRPKHPEGDDPRGRDGQNGPPPGRMHRPPPDASPGASPDSSASPSPGDHRGPDGRHHGPPPDGERHQPADQPGASPGGSPSASPDGRRHGPPHPDPLFEALDTNNDGVITADEIEAASTSLKKADTNGDGKIDRADMRPPPPPRAPGQ